MLYDDKTSTELVAMHNALAAKLKKPLLKNWKGKKTVLRDRVIALEAEGRSELHTKIFNAAAKRTKKTTTKTKVSRFQPKLTGQASIRSIALELLTEVDFHEDKTKRPSDSNRVSANHPHARSVGFSYEAIVDKIRNKYDGAQTSAACLRWYVVKMRNGDSSYEGYDLPNRRPRGVRS